MRVMGPGGFVSLLLLMSAVSPARAGQGCSGVLSRLMPYAGTYYSAQLLKQPAVSSALGRLLGDEEQHLKNNLNVAGPIDLIGCSLVVSGNAEHQGGTQEAVVAIDVHSGKVSAAILSAGRIAIYTVGGHYGTDVPLAIKDWLAVVYTRGYFRIHPPSNARVLTCSIHEADGCRPIKH